MIELSTNVSDVILDAIGALMDAGRIEILTADDQVLAVLRLSDPAAMPASGGELEFNDIAEEDAALAQGIATSARIIAINGGEILACDVGDMNSDAVIKLNTTKIFRGGPVRLTSFKLAMP